MHFHAGAWEREEGVDVAVGAAFSRDCSFGAHIFSWLKATPTNKISLS